MNTEVSLAASSHMKADLSTDTLTTMNFFTMKPVYFHEVVPGEKVDIDMFGKMRMLALNKPMFGNLTCKTRTFFVPYRIIFPHWNSFITDSREANSKFTKVPTVSVYGLIHSLAFDNTITTSEQISGATSVAYDFIIRDDTEDNGVARGFVFTKKGRRINDILKGFGYNLPWGYTYTPNQSGSIYEKTNTTLGEVNVLSLMAYGKIVSDWFTLPAYQDKINTILAAINTICTLNQSEGTILTNLKLILDLCIDLHYSDDIFVSAWDNPVAPNDGTGSQSIHLSDITVNALGDNYKSRVDFSSPSSTSSTYNTTNGTPVLRSAGSNSYPSNVSQYILNALQKLSSFMRRNQIVGYRPLDRYLVRYGKKLDSEQLLRSIVLGEADFKIYVDEVVSLSDTVDPNEGLGQSLGDYAGKGIGETKGHIHFESDEFGVLVTVCYIIPYVKYYQGLHPSNRRTGMMDYFQPEFDGLGCEAIPSNTLTNSSINSFVSSGYTTVPQSQYPNSDYVFGYAPRGYSYKTNPYATVSGDFALNSRNVGYEQWHLFRKINSNVLGTSYAWKHNQRFTEGSVDADNYNRIFQVSDGENDGFILGFHFNVDAQLPMKPLYDDYILNSDPDSEHARGISMQVGGTRLS